MLLLLWGFINPWCDLDWSIAYRLGLLIIRRILRSRKSSKNGLQKWFMDRYGDLNYKDRLSLLELPSLEERRIRGDLIEAFKLLKGIANLDYSLFFKLSEDSKVRGHTYKLLKIVFAWMLENISLVIEWWMHGMSCLSMWLMQKL